MSEILDYKVVGVFNTSNKAEAIEKFAEMRDQFAGRGFTPILLACMDDDSEMVMGSPIARPLTTTERRERAVERNKVLLEQRPKPLNVLPKGKRRKHQRN